MFDCLSFFLCPPPPTQELEELVKGPAELKELVDVIFERSLKAALFCQEFAQYRTAIMYKLPIFVYPVKGRKRMVTFKYFLLRKCRAELDRYDELAKTYTAEQKNKVQERMLDNVRLIGELFSSLRLFSFKSEAPDYVQIVYTCIDRLLTSINKERNVCLGETVECLCKLMETVRGKLDYKYSKDCIQVDYSFEMRKTAEQLGRPEVPDGKRLEHLILDTIDRMEHIQ